MQIDERKVGDVTILDMKGKMTLGDGDELLRTKINGVIQAGAKKIVLNLGDVPYIDSAARLAISEELGHQREQITAVYLGR